MLHEISSDLWVSHHYRSSALAPESDMFPYERDDGDARRLAQGYKSCILVTLKSLRLFTMKYQYLNTCQGNFKCCI